MCGTAGMRRTAYQKNCANDAESGLAGPHVSRSAWYAWAAGRDLIITDESHLDFAEVAMQRMPVCALAALASFALAPHAVHAQAAFTNGYIEWSLRPDAPRVPYDGAPFSEKYNYTAS